MTGRATDGRTLDLTDQLIDYFGGAEIDVRFPQEDIFGNCPPELPN